MKVNPPASLSLFLKRRAAFWQALTIRERRWVLMVSAVLVLILLWFIALLPALDTLRKGESQHRELDAQLETMRVLAAEAAQLQALPRIGADDRRRALDASVAQHLGSAAQLAVAGERASVTLKNVSPQALVQWLEQARSSAKATPVEVRLNLSTSRSGWDGSVVLILPPP